MAGFANQLSTWAADFAPRIWATFLRGPPKAFNPTYLTATNWMKRWKEVEREENAKGNWGFGKAYNKARMETTLRKGQYVGSDYNGNKYYEDKSAPYGRTRWVEYPTPGGTWAIEQRCFPHGLQLGMRSLSFCLSSPRCFSHDSRTSRPL